MAHKLAILSLCFLVACVPGSRTWLSPQARLADKLEHETVALVEPDEDGSEHIYCAAVWVGSDQLLTAAHCVEDAGENDLQRYINKLLELPEPNPLGAKVEYKTVDDDRAGVKASHAGVVVKYDREDDLALVQTSKSPDHGSADVRREPVVSGEDVEVVGHPYGLGWSYSHGNADGLRDIEDDDVKEQRLQLSVLIHPGNSGGGAFDEDGDLIGICSFYVAGQPDVAFFVGQDLVHKFLEAK